MIIPDLALVIQQEFTLTTCLQYSIRPPFRIDGEWTDEPDLIEWELPQLKLIGQICRHGQLGYLCGYIALAPESLITPRELELLGKSDMQTSREISFTGYIRVRGKTENDAKQKAFALGFHCMHFRDYSPVIYNKDMIVKEYIWYRNVLYVAHEVMNMVYSIRHRYQHIIDQQDD